MLKLATPVSHLFRESRDFANRISQLSDTLECRDRTWNYHEGNQELFHSDLQPIHFLDQRIWEYFSRIKETKSNLKLLTFHIASNCDAPILEGKMWKSGGRTYSREDMLLNAKENFARIRSIFGNKIKIAIENNNYYPTDAYQTVCEPDFISQLANENDLYFLFDIAHAKVSAINMKKNFNKYIDGFPFDRLIQVHICQYRIDDQGMAYDAHEPPEKEIYEVLQELLKYPTLQYLTMEYYKTIEILEKSLIDLRAFTNGRLQ